MDDAERQETESNQSTNDHDGERGQSRGDYTWHVRPAEDALNELDSDPEQGLSPSRAQRLHEEHGPNEIRSDEGRPWWRLLLAQFNDFMIWVLAAAALFSAFEGQTAEAIAIGALLTINAILGFVQEFRAEQALEELQQMAAPEARVVRHGEERQITPGEVVPGDIVVLDEGDRIPADGRLIAVEGLKTQEATLTGESVAIQKQTDPIDDEDAPLGDRTNMVFAGTSVSAGDGRYVVTAIGRDTEMGGIADLLAEQEEGRTPLQRELREVGKRIAAAVLIVAVIMFGIEAWQAWSAAGTPSLQTAWADATFRNQLATALLIAVSLGVAAIPEGLPSVVTVALSLGVRRMADRNVIVRKLHAVETLGSTTIICTDKTGTLTRNEMMVRRIALGKLTAAVEDGKLAEEDGDIDADSDTLALLLRIAASCNDAEYNEDDDEFVGDPTEIALLSAARSLGGDEVRQERVGVVPFESERKRMTTVHEREDGRVAYTKGGADMVLGLCSAALIDEERKEMTDELREELSDINATLAQEGLRTLLCAYRELNSDDSSDDESIEHDLVYVGIFGMLDPPREGVAQAISECHDAGIMVAMVTGDHEITAQAIADELGLRGEVGEDTSNGTVLTGPELAEMSDAELTTAAGDVRIYARVDPKHKLRIVEVLKARGEVVAMTGDGVNDAPALKRADIGVAMGRIGTDVSREASDMVLADDNFATIVEAVRQGRIVFDNLRKFIVFLLSCNVSEVLVVFITAVALPYPVLMPLQILWVNLVIDGLPSLALSIDPPEPGVMKRPPRDPDETLLNRERQIEVMWRGALMTLSAGVVYGAIALGWIQAATDSHVQTLVFTALVLSQIFYLFNVRSGDQTIFSAESLRNRWLLGAMAAAVVLHLGVVYVPFLQGVFNTYSLAGSDWVLLLVAAPVPALLIDAIEAIQRRRRVRSGM